MLELAAAATMASAEPGCGVGLEWKDVFSEHDVLKEALVERVPGRGDTVAYTVVVDDFTELGTRPKVISRRRAGCSGCWYITSERAKSGLHTDSSCYRWQLT